jgi:sterol desaturase/sphingolipid hydroxylase (fatty acid hydroxylase superfamily)
VATGFRFHPGEVLIGQGIFLLAIAVLAPPPFAVFCYELANIAQNAWSHANLRLPERFEKALGLVLVTPEFHRIHHSIEAAEQRSNLAILFSFWDRLFHTYRAHPNAGEENLSFGLEEVTAAQSIQPLAMLALPFATPARDPRPLGAMPIKSGANDSA